MVKRFSNERLREWAESLLHEENPLGYSLLGYAEEWRLDNYSVQILSERCTRLEGERDELRAALTDLVFQCEKYPHIQTDRAKAVLYPSET